MLKTKDLNNLEMEPYDAGCYHCGEKEGYNGAENTHIRYLCSVCTFHYSFMCVKAFKEVEARLRPLRKSRRIRGPNKKKERRTLSNAMFKRK